MLTLVEVETSQELNIVSRHGLPPRGASEGTLGALEYTLNVWIYIKGRHPVEFAIRLPNGVTTYKAGWYLIDLGHNMIGDKYNGLSFKPFSTYQLFPLIDKGEEKYRNLEKQLLELVGKPF